MIGNDDVLSLLDVLQDYLRSQALLQSAMSDGYIELANCRRLGTGTLVPDVVLSPDRMSEQRTVTETFEIGQNCMTVLAAGVSESCIRKIRAEFENALGCVLQLAKIKQQCAEKCGAVAARAT
jgi:hypothetical protein